LNYFFHESKGSQSTNHHYGDTHFVFNIFTPVTKVGLLIRAVDFSTKFRLRIGFTPQSLADFQGIKTTLIKQSGCNFSFTELKAASKLILDPYFYQYGVVIIDFGFYIPVYFAMEAQPIFKGTPPLIITVIGKLGRGANPSVLD
jgi:hypothetical protein